MSAVSGHVFNQVSESFLAFDLAAVAVVAVLNDVSDLSGFCLYLRVSNLIMIDERYAIRI